MTTDLRFLSRTAVVLALFWPFAQSIAHAQTGADSAAARSIAEAALEGRPGEVFLRAGDLDVATAAITALRHRFPEVRGVGPEPSRIRELELVDSAWRTVAARAPASGSTYVLTQTGLRGLDSLNAFLGVREMRVEPGLRRVVPLVHSPVNVGVLAELYRRLPEVRRSHEPLYFGVEGGMKVRLQGEAVEMQLWRGWGDCMAGCIHSHRWTFRYDPRRNRVSRLQDEGDRLPRAANDTG